MTWSSHKRNIRPRSRSSAEQSVTSGCREALLFGMAKAVGRERLDGWGCGCMGVFEMLHASESDEDTAGRYIY